MTEAHAVGALFVVLLFVAYGVLSTSFRSDRPQIVILAAFFSLLGPKIVLRLASQ